ncbi:MAG: DMT family transporter [Desulfobacterales bacterium]|jgi:bacterial/archaeal transporter family protein
MKEWLLPASMTLICWGIWGFIPKITTRYINPLSASVFEGLGSAVFALIVLFSLSFKPEIHPKGVSLAFITGLLGMLGALFYLFAMPRGKVSVIATIVALNPAITIALAYFFLKEPITLKEGLGMVFACVAIVLFTV